MIIALSLKIIVKTTARFWRLRKRLVYIYVSFSSSTVRGLGDIHTHTRARAREDAESTAGCLVVVSRVIDVRCSAVNESNEKVYIGWWVRTRALIGHDDARGKLLLLLFFSLPTWVYLFNLYTCRCPTYSVMIFIFFFYFHHTHSNTSARPRKVYIRIHVKISIVCAC